MKPRAVVVHLSSRLWGEPGGGMLEALILVGRERSLHDSGRHGVQDTLYLQSAVVT